MSCTEFEIRDYFLGELSEAERLRIDRHVTGCQNCASELDSLRYLRTALKTVPDQEPPQRIGFVSDKVFEPSSVRRAWNSFWLSGSRLGFVSAAMLSAALVTFAFHPPAVRFAEKPVPIATAVAPDPTPLINEAVRKAVAQTEARQEKRTQSLLAAAERRHELDDRALILRVEGSFTNLQKRMMVTRASSINFGGEGQ
ncbi:MAG: zf-HC2 domain-containing protein [Acidobacteriota bacterium]|nr:zf-HC2 domain-containing protein [Acidobacteriota bacterium]